MVCEDCWTEIIINGTCCVIPNCSFCIFITCLLVSFSQQKKHISQHLRSLVTCNTACMLGKKSFFKVENLLREKDRLSK